MKKVDWQENGLIPGLLYFQNGGTHTGSVSDRENRETKEFRYKLEAKDGMVNAFVWYGPFCFEKSEIVDRTEFSADSEGYSNMICWLKEKYESMIA